MCVCVCLSAGMYTTYMQVPVSSEEDIRSEVTGSCDMGAWNQTWDLWKSSKCS